MILEKILLKDFLDIFISLLNNYEEDNIDLEESKTYNEWLDEVISYTNIAGQFEQVDKSKDGDIYLYFNCNKKDINVSINDNVSQKDIQQFISHITSQKDIFNILIKRATKLNQISQSKIIESIKNIIYKDSIILPTEVFSHGSTRN